MRFAVFNNEEEDPTVLFLNANSAQDAIDTACRVYRFWGATHALEVAAVGDSGRFAWLKNNEPKNP
jgi:hypothetical protein